MRSDKYTLDSILSDLLEVTAVVDFLDRAAPGMRESSTFSYVRSATIAQLLENGGDTKKPMFMALLALANGREPEFEPKNSSEILPRIDAREGLAYNIDEIDGPMYMLDHALSGCLVLRFSKQMNEEIYGTVTCGEEQLPKGILRAMESAGGIQMLGIPVTQCFTAYDTTYVLRIEGFVDMDGNTMLPQEITVRTLPKPIPDPAYAANDEVALQAAREGIVLLKNNDGVLPLKSNSSIAIIGGHLFRNSAGGAGSINPRYSIGLARAIDEYSDFVQSEAAETGVILISRGSSENFDNRPIRGEFYLSDDEERMVSDVVRKYSKTIAIINSGYPMDLRWLDQMNIHAAVWCGFPGMLGGRALVEILDGRVNPSGKLPDTWSLDYYDIPASANFYAPKDGEAVLSTDAPVFVNTVYEEDIYVGYRYFETFDKPVAYPFGYGLSYTAFDIKAVQTEWLVHATIQNTGDAAGKEVVQIYAQIPDGRLEQPVKRLVAFAKTRELMPGEAQILTLHIDKAELASFDTKGARWIIEKGVYAFYAGNSVKQLQPCGEWVAGQDEVIKQVENLMAPPIDIKTLSKTNPGFLAGKHSGVVVDAASLTPKAHRKHYPDPSDYANDMVSHMSVEELARLSVCAAAGWGMHEKGEAGKIFRLQEHDIPTFVVADGNSGVKINKPNIGMPASNTVCATFNTEIAYNVGRVIAREARENGIDMILAPGMNIHRNPLNGRHPEYFSEDPYLTGIMAGHQSKGLEENGVSSSLKHLVCNNCEGARKRNQTIVSERALREIYIKAFAVAMSVHKPDSVMTAYNAVNGIYTGEDEELIQGIFRQELDFEGFVMTDWNAYDTQDIASAIAAGNTWMTPGSLDNTYVAPIIEGVRNGKIKLSRLQNNVRYMLHVANRRTGRK